ncbi:2-succinyl-6-hydroxy-2,4-cyclohexadiene-1-carboxylate synthase [Vibrio astriarenae]|uniref:2-succinyl-6-hydroxy-2, 4-cyclohexadiene-1-carboxylate synthase n=1 Tax=Vibrio astriarenae TaxID=1481923 RepID=UPI00373539A9
MLFSQYIPPNASTRERAHSLPLLVFLHGFLGSHEDWLASTALLDDYPRLLIDLPGFGRSRHLSCHSLDCCFSRIKDTLIQPSYQGRNIVIVGYSMGGRLALRGLVESVFAQLPLVGVVVEGAHFGLQDAQARHDREHNDEQWASRFEQEPIEQVLSDWYQQAVFSSLNNDQRQTLVDIRSDNLGQSIGAMLRLTSLAHQSYLLPSLHKQTVPIRYLCGEKDEKFKQLAVDSGLPYTLIQGAGHNVHHQCPAQFASALRDIVETF